MTATLLAGAPCTLTDTDPRDNYAYVIAGTAVTYGLPFDAILAEVHRSNMSKFGPDGPRVRADGKIIKGPGYEPPRIAALLGEEGTDE